MTGRSFLRIGIDTGGTFTDLVVETAAGTRHAKVASTPDDPAGAFEAALRLAGWTPGQPADIRHGTTVGTNAVLTRAGARVVFVGTRGHAEAPRLGRGDRADLFALAPRREPPLLAADDVVEAPGRLAADGSELEPFDAAGVARLVAAVRARRPEAIAVALLHATRDPGHERALADALAVLGVPVSSGARLSAEPRETERAITAILDATVAPRMDGYASRLRAILGSDERARDVTILRSDGGRMTLGDVAVEPVRTLVSGPAAGAVAAAALARQLGLAHAVGFDVGGTSTDVVWIEGGEVSRRNELHVGPWRAGVASLAIRTIGAGGGSMISLDTGGALTVGPASAGADPGPAAYGRGGPFTLTDAWLLLGRLPSALADGGVLLDEDAARRAAQPIAEATGLSLDALCEGAVRVAAGATARALRAVSAREGRDPERAALIAFGGAGPLLAADAALALGLSHVVVPPAPGTFAAAGTLLVPRGADVEADVAGVDALDELHARARSLEAQARARLGASATAVTVQVGADVRFRGQDDGVSVAFDASWENAARSAIRERFGFELADRPLEIVRLRATARDVAPTTPTSQRTGVAPPATTIRHDGRVRRAELSPGSRVVGPVRVEEATATTWIPDGARADIDADGLLHITWPTNAAARRATAASEHGDAIRLAVLRDLLESVTDEIAIVCRRMAVSPNIRERRDLSAALFLADGRLLAHAAHIPVHLGAMPRSVEAVRTALDLGPGDGALVNDPYAGGSHLPDLTLVRGVFDERVSAKPLAYLAVRAHHADVGGAVPGSMAPADDIHAEGVRVPPLIAFRDADLDPTFARLFLANVRHADEREADLRAQAASLSRGEALLRGLATARGGLGPMLADGAGLIEATRRRIGPALAALPDAEASVEVALDAEDRAGRPARIRLALRKVGARLEADFTGTTGPVGHGLNAPRAVTESALYYFLACLAPPQTAPNDGLLDMVSIRIPPGSLLDARPPQPVAGGNVETSQRVVDALWLAAAACWPRRIPAPGAGSMSNWTFGPAPDGPSFPVYYETLPGGAGGGPQGPGADAIQQHMTNTLSTPAEALERRWPVRVERHGLSPTAGGDGGQRGGRGLWREIRFLAPAMASFLMTRHGIAPPGVCGGSDGSPGRIVLVRNGRETAVAPRGVLRIEAGDLLRFETPGGGGYGTPKAR